jgi:hypothetical protein
VGGSHAGPPTAYGATRRRRCHLKPARTEKFSIGGLFKAAGVIAPVVVFYKSNQSGDLHTAPKHSDFRLKKHDYFVNFQKRFTLTAPIIISNRHILHLFHLRRLPIPHTASFQQQYGRNRPAQFYFFYQNTPHLQPCYSVTYIFRFPSMPVPAFGRVCYYS